MSFVNTVTIPLFPLHTVLFPGGPLPLRIFEPRYLDMVSRCMKQDQPFGVCLISSGSETGTNTELYNIGTLATITDWNQLPEGLLGIVVEGGERFTVMNTTRQPDRLLVGEVTPIPPDPIEPIGVEHSHLVPILKELLNESGALYAGLELKMDNAAWVGFRLSELLPMDLACRQELLELSSPLQRLDRLVKLVEALTRH